MSWPVVHVRVPEQLLARLDALCSIVQQTRSAAIRESLQYLLDRPELWPELLARPTSTTIADTRTPEQIQNWEQDQEQFLHIDLGPLLRTTTLM